MNASSLASVVNSVVDRIASPLATFGNADPEKVRTAAQYVAGLSDEEKRVVSTWLTAEALLAGLYYILIAIIVFLLGRRIIVALVAAYREARAESA